MVFRDITVIECHRDAVSWQKRPKVAGRDSPLYISVHYRNGMYSLQVTPLLDFEA